ncbi:MAG TPA: hemerythrin domain-containing protein [Thermoanaerobaculia bacterium]
MTLRTGRLVGEVAATVPEAIDAFRVAGVDCCRDARLTLEQAAVRTGIRSDRLLALMRHGTPTRSATDWESAPLRALTRYIVESVHPTATAAMETLSSRLAAAAHAHPNEWSIGYVRSAFAEVANNLVIHVWRVENEVFPLLDRLEEEVRDAVPRIALEELPDPRDPMLEGLRDLRAVTREYTQPEELGSLLSDIRAFDDGLHRHIHLEHHVLYPRAAALCACPLGDAARIPVLTWL